METTTLLLRHVRMGDGGRPAISFEDQQTWTYDDLAARVYQIAHALIALGVVKGDRVGILLKNSLDYWAVYLAIVRLGGIAVRLNWRLAAPELAYALADSGTKVLLVHDELLDSFAQVVRDAALAHVVVVDPQPDCALADGHHALETLLASMPVTDPDVPLPDVNDPCMIMYTSGTTGYPKGAVWTHGNSLWFSALQSAYWRFDRGTVHFSTGPMFHVGGFEDWCLPTLMGGGHLVVLRSGAFDIARVSQIAQHHGATTLGLLPAMIYELINWQDVRDDALGKVGRIYTGGSPILLSAVQRLRQLFPKVELQQVYGLTEGGAISTVMDPAHLDQHPTSVGKPLPFTEIRIARLGDEQVDADPGEDGHLWVRSPGVCGNYYGKIEATRETFVDGWCRTGDLARLTSDHYLYITGRVKDMIISGGENIYPVEIENVLSAHPAVRDVAVIGVPDPKWGETPCAVVVLHDGQKALPEEALTEALTAHVMRSLASYKKPRRIEYVAELPRNASGKVLKRVLREQFH